MINRPGSGYMDLTITCTVHHFLICAAAEQDYLSRARHPLDSNESLLQSYIAGLLSIRQTPCSPCSAPPEISPPHPNSNYVVTIAKRKYCLKPVKHELRKPSTSLQPSKSRATIRNYTTVVELHYRGNERAIIAKTPQDFLRLAKFHYPPMLPTDLHHLRK